MRGFQELRYYVLDDEHRVQPAGLMEWARFFEHHDKRVVAQTELLGGVLVSTVFIGMPLNVLGGGPPLLFETMVFELNMDGGDNECWRYSSWDDAETGHQAVVRRVKAFIERIRINRSPVV